MVEIIYENPGWLPFFQEALEEIGVSYRLNNIEEFALDTNQPPDNILYLNRISPSSHTRGHLRAVINGEQYLEHLSAFNRRVINDYRTIDYEMSKVAQYRLLSQHGLAYPQTAIGSEIDDLLHAARTMTFPLLTKHNFSGKGMGIRLLQDLNQLHDYLKSDDYLPSPDGILLLQQYIKPKNGYITRVEILDGKLVYAFRSSTEQGFDLCPADSCQIERRTDKARGLASAPDSADSLFTYIPDFDHPLVGKYIELCKAAGFDMAGIEFVQGEDNAVYTYDINGTSNYSGDVERQSDHRAKHSFQTMVQRLV